MKYRFLYTMSAIALAAGICTSCQKETEPSPDPGTSGGQVTVIATISDGGTKVSYSESGSNLNQSWTVGDHIVGWDASGKKIELEIKDESMIKDGKAIFTPVTGSAAVPSSGKVYMIYAPGKSYTDVSEKSLTYNLSSQDGSSVPALMTATGTVSNNTLTLGFTNEMAIVAVKNPKLPVSEATMVSGLTLNGSNILTTATFGMNGETLTLTPSGSGSITKACSFTTAADGNTANTTVCFAVLPNTTAADVTVKTVDPAGYEITKANKSFAAGKCYMLTAPEASKQQFSITVADGIEHGTITTSPESTCAWDETVTVTATPATGYKLTALKYNDGSSDNNISITGNTGTFNMPKANVTVSGTFQKIDYTITKNAATGGTYTVQKGSPLADATTGKMDEEIFVSVTPDDGYSGGTVTVAETTSGNSVTVTGNTFTMPAADVTITVSFNHDEYDITGNVSPSSEAGTVKFKKSDSEVTKAHYEEEIIVDATPATGYELVSITAKDANNAVVNVTNGKFTMPAKNVTVTVTFKKSINGHEYVMIGGKKWATTNIGATNPQDYGKYFQWGEIAGHECNGTTNGSTFKDSHIFDWASAPFNNGKSNYDGTYFKNNKSTWITDDVLKPDYDAAYKSWGSSWRMPTKDDFIALDKACGGDGSNGQSMTAITSSHIVSGKVKKGKYWLAKDQKVLSDIDELKSITAAGMLYSDGENYLFFPAAGFGNTGNLDDAGTYGYYWSSTLYSDSTDFAFYMYFRSGNVSPRSTNSRYNGFSVRPLSD